MKLFYSPASPFARKVIVTAHEAELADQVEMLNIAFSICFWLASKNETDSSLSSATISLR